MKFGVNTELAKSLRLTIHFTILLKIKFNICKLLLWFQLFETEFHRWFGIPSISSRHSWSSWGFRIQRVHLLATTCSWYAWWRRSCQIHHRLFRFKQATSSSGDEKWTLGIRFRIPPTCNLWKFVLVVVILILLLLPSSRVPFILVCFMPTHCLIEVG